MPLPVKAIRYGQLKPKTAGLAVPTSGHEVIKVEFEDTDGQIKTGFYKELVPEGKGDGSYPEILAKYVVAASVLFRLALGDRAAEDRLVFDSEGRIKGTLSVAAENYKPLHCSGQSLPADPQERELVCPSVETLLKYNVAELFASIWGRMFCDDRHPGNFSLNVLIDWDMTLYQYTSFMKGKRVVDGLIKELPQKSMKLMSKQLNDFPIVEGRTHYPTNAIPENGNILKRFQSYAEFQKLAANPAIQTENGSICFQEQLFSALLKELITFDPEMLRERLKEYIGEELTLDYTSLPQEKSEGLAQAYPHLFNKDTDKKPFLDHIMDVFQLEYNEFYKTVVLYPGCPKNKSGVAVPGFNRFLRNKPSAFTKAIEWALAMNARMEKAWADFCKYKQEEEPLLAALDVYAIPPEGRYNLKKMQQRYHQVWRDSHTPTIRAIIADGHNLIHELACSLGSQSINLNTNQEVDNDGLGLLSESFQLLGEPELLTESSDIDSNSSEGLKQGLKALEELFFSFQNNTKQYFLVKRDELSPENNQAYCDAISDLIREAQNKILPYFIGTGWARKFGYCIKNMEKFYQGLHFQRHLISTDAPLSEGAAHDYSALLTRLHTDEEVVNSCLKTLFSWVNTIPRETFNNMILGIIQEYQPPFYALWAQRYRGPVVEAYLKSSKQDCANRLAWILSDGGTEITSLNTHIMKALIPIMLDATQAQLEIDLLSVRNAVEHDAFNGKYYAERAQTFVKKDKAFEITVSEKRIDSFCELLFSWAAKQPSPHIRQIVKDALKAYTPSSLNFFSGKNRQSEIEAYLKEVPRPDNAKLLALIFKKGKHQASSLNVILLDLLIKKMKDSLSSTKVREELGISNTHILSDILPKHYSQYSEHLQRYASHLKYDESSEHSAVIH
ncbi:hypothetical protein [Legionella jordanis]|uniref:Uncharacterized protein n=1 Tax=Legionella jordanis TaxID=456 RepID=A0A0W0VCU5_9GAMM|nr:hypothetical protein [Legionella jordanis]KTD17957.1 hypothetical protein Ljor_2263 [Legionella jordanis]RMX02350.1 hypothetical protein EAW55_08830 [Legionella jordanis]RMX15770.1 hypothetical protein EAS68_11705 [Legionella jordanis]VEH13951.1 Uncharacterised protein [Legionella jordanis]